MLLLCSLKSVLLEIYGWLLPPFYLAWELYLIIVSLFL